MAHASTSVESGLGMEREQRRSAGELAGNRTQDPRIKSALLYQLSYELTVSLLLLLNGTTRACTTTRADSKGTRLRVPLKVSFCQCYGR